MKNHRFLWLRNRTTDNRKCEKARNIKEKRTIEMFSTDSRQQEELLSSRKDKDYCEYAYKMAQSTSLLVSGAIFVCVFVRMQDAAPEIRRIFGVVSWIRSNPVLNPSPINLNYLSGQVIR